MFKRRIGLTSPALFFCAAFASLVFCLHLPQFTLMKTMPRFLLILALTLAPFAAQAQTRGQQPSADYVNILEGRLASLEQQVQTLTNQAEQANYQARTAQERLQRLEEDLNTRFRMLEAQTAQAAATPAPAATTASEPQTLGQMTAPAAAGTAPVMPADANVAYDQAFSKIRDGDYESAEVAMRAFLQRWPDIDLSSNAAYWLGETFYVRGDFAGAAKSFAEAYQQYPKGAKSEDTLLKLALALGALNRTTDACVTFEQLVAEFPRMSATNRRRVEQERTQLNCPASSQASSATTPRRNTRNQRN